MAKLSPVQPPEGLDDAWVVLHWLANPDKAKEAQDYLDQLQVLHDEINTKIELVGPAESIVALNRQAEIDAAAAKDKLIEAGQRYSDIVAEGNAKVAEDQEKVDAARAQLTADQDAFRRKLATDLTALEARIGAVEKRENEVASREAAVAKTEAESSAIKADLLARAEAVQRAAAG